MHSGGMERNMEGVRVGYALCGSFCTIKKSIAQMKLFKDTGALLYPIMSEIVYSTDTRFGTAESLIKQVEDICERKVIHDVIGAEPIGPKQMLDILIVAPCTGNTMGKLACCITDSSVTMAAKAHLRNERPLLIAPATNDALSSSAKNIGILLATKNVFFVPFCQDSPELKPRSCISDFSKIYDSAVAALQGNQVQPILC